MSRNQPRLSRRKLLLGGAAVAAPTVPLLHGVVPHQGLHEAIEGSSAASSGHSGGAHGGAAPAAAPAPSGFQPGAVVDHAANGFNPTEILREFDHGRTRRLVSGRVLREWELTAVDQ